MATQRPVVLPLALKNDTKQELAKVAADFRKADDAAEAFTAQLKAVSASGRDLSKLSQPLQDAVAKFRRVEAAAEKAAKAARKVGAVSQFAGGLTGGIQGGLGAFGSAAGLGGAIGGQISGVATQIVGALKDAFFEALRDIEQGQKDDIALGSSSREEIATALGERLGQKGGVQVELARSFEREAKRQGLDPDQFKGEAARIAGSAGILSGDVERDTATLVQISQRLDALTSERGLGLDKGLVTDTIIDLIKGGESVEGAVAGIVQGRADAGTGATAEEFAEAVKNAAKQQEDIAQEAEVVQDLLRGATDSVREFEETVDSLKGFFRSGITGDGFGAARELERLADSLDAFRDRLDAGSGVRVPGELPGPAASEESELRKKLLEAELKSVEERRQAQAEAREIMRIARERQAADPSFGQRDFGEFLAGFGTTPEEFNAALGNF